MSGSSSPKREQLLFSILTMMGRGDVPESVKSDGWLEID
jgi:hypothetical protein